ncbi:MAG: hypothetical protein IIU02_02940, partial [Treponema sp.]|uniref:hypothetical protein n=1 Tax=Treponema sp. TaxID=166 RepID=UPI00257B559C
RVIHLSERARAQQKLRPFRGSLFSGGEKFFLKRTPPFCFKQGYSSFGTGAGATKAATFSGKSFFRRGKLLSEKDATVLFQEGLFIFRNGRGRNKSCALFEGSLFSGGKNFFAGILLMGKVRKIVYNRGHGYEN